MPALAQADMKMAIGAGTDVAAGTATAACPSGHLTGDTRVLLAVLDVEVLPGRQPVSVTTGHGQPGAGLPRCGDF
jgi:hypothetical protein